MPHKSTHTLNTSTDRSFTQWLFNFSDNLSFTFFFSKLQSPLLQVIILKISPFKPLQVSLALESRCVDKVSKESTPPTPIFHYPRAFLIHRKGKGNRTTSKSATIPRPWLTNPGLNIRRLVVIAGVMVKIYIRDAPDNWH